MKKKKQSKIVRKLATQWRRVKQRHARLPRWKRLTIHVLVALLALYALHRLVSAAIPEVKNPSYGVSFSIKYANELGVDWKENYTALLDDMGLKKFRLMSYWDDIEPERGKYDFTDLDWQMDQAAKRGASVSLAIGMRQPRWPECHKPAWYNELGSRSAEADAIVKYTETVVKRYKEHPALISYQLENEAVNNWFGECTPEDIDQKRLERQFAAVKAIDSVHPVYMSLSDQHGLPLGKPVPDKYGFSVYRVVWNNKTGPLQFYTKYPTPVWYHRLRAWWIQVFKERDIFIHELQMEPWGPKATVDLSVAEQNRSMSADQIRENVRFARKIGRPQIYTWGGEWWYWRKTTLHDPSIWEAVKTELDRK